MSIVQSGLIQPTLITEIVQKTLHGGNGYTPKEPTNFVTLAGDDLYTSDGEQFLVKGE